VVFYQLFPFIETEQPISFAKKYLLFLPFCHLTTFIALKLNQILPEQKLFGGFNITILPLLLHETEPNFTRAKLFGGFSVTLPFYHFYTTKTKLNITRAKTPLAKVE